MSVMRRMATGCCLAVVIILAVAAPLYGAEVKRIERGELRVEYDDRGVTQIEHARDPFGAKVIADGQRLGVSVRGQAAGGKWEEWATEGQPGEMSYVRSRPGAAVKVTEAFTVERVAMDWLIELENTSAASADIGDVAVAVPWRRPTGEDPKAIFEGSFVKHQFIAGHGSFLHFVRAGGMPPFLVMTALPGTKLEYYSIAGGKYRAYIHSAAAGQEEKRGTWRQAHTALQLAPGAKARYGFRFRWAESWERMRAILVEEGLFDIRIVPGMTLPNDLAARIAIRTRAKIEEIRPEFPAQTRLVELAEREGGWRIWKVQFGKLGENRLTIRHDGGQETHLEFFSTEPLETLIRKRADFLVRRQQHRDPSKWYDGLFSVYDMRAKVLRSPDDTDGFDGWWGYVIAADDPALCKAPFVAAKNVHFPVREEIAAVEYYLDRFVWGKLQRTDKETPYPYGIYGTPNWKVARDPVERAKISKTNLDKMHVWRSYDYPHMAMLYFHMYQIARMYPGMTRYLDAGGYLERAYQTARAFYRYPNEILPYYETHKWGCYNELVILSIIAALEEEGRPAEAAELRGEWEKKAKYFIYDDPYPYRSEYAFDRTAFESSYALAKYGATHDMKPDEKLWFDRNLDKWYSHPKVSRDDARAFMERQLAANLAVRGWLETSYHLLGADFTASSDRGCLSYMAKMGGWAILDYGVNFAAEPSDWLQLGYASCLSSWALMNTGREDTGYGYWFPGRENDGAAGWQFMPAKWGTAWIRKEVPRGPWHYDGEIDLGFSAGLRAAATIVAPDPIFGWVGYGATMEQRGDEIAVVPRDGVRKRFYAIGPAGRVKIELERDGFAAGEPVVLDTALKQVAFAIENRTGDAHTTRIRISAPADARLYQDGRQVELKPTGDASYPLRAEVRMGRAASRMELRAIGPR